MSKKGADISFHRGVFAPNVDYVDFLWIFQGCRAPLKHLESKGSWTQLFAGDTVEYV